MTGLMAVDTAAGACSVALWRDGEVVAHRCEPMARGHAEAVVPMMQAALSEARWAVASLDAVGVTVGPGAFTGLRIGLSAARGVALAANIPAVGVGSLEALAHGTVAEERGGRVVAAVLDTKRGDLYAQLFEADLTPITGPSVATAEAVLARMEGREILSVGDGTVPGAVPSVAPPWPDARVVAALAARRLAEEPAPEPPRPLYLREPEARLPEPR